jgi:hypothetical protein
MESHKRAASALSLPACHQGGYARRSLSSGPPKAGPVGRAMEKVRVRGLLHKLRLAERPPHPAKTISPDFAYATMRGAAPARPGSMHDHPGQDIGLQHHQKAHETGECDRVAKYEAQDGAFVAEPVGGCRGNHDRLGVDHFAHDAA